mgnify:CR=1 FL=1
MKNISALLAGKRGLVMGVANERAIAWGIASRLSDHGAEIAFTYHGEAFEKRVRPLAEGMGSEFILPCDVRETSDQESVIEVLEHNWGHLDFVVHSLAYSDKKELLIIRAITAENNKSSPEAASNLKNHLKNLVA